jgi:CheY-like chemotaxis protein
MPTIAVIEDNDSDIDLLELALAVTGAAWRIHAIRDGAAAREFVLAAPATKPQIDLVLLDLNLPKVDGFALLSLIRAREWFQSIPVIVWSSTRSSADYAQVTALGATDFWFKPANLQDWRSVAERLHALLEGTGTISTATGS